MFVGARATDEQGRTRDDEASIWAQAMSENWTGKMDVRDVQERWIDRKEEFDEVERRAWEEEARMAGALPEQSAARVKRVDDGDAMDTGDEGEDEVLAQQRQWEETRRKNGDNVDVGTRVVRKG